MKYAALALTIALTGLTTGGCATLDENSVAASQQTMTVSGQVAYRQRIALAPGSMVTVTLEDVSLADAPSQTVASKTFATDGRQVPIAFELEVDPNDLMDRRRYSLRVTIAGPDGDLAWTSDAANIVTATGGDQDLGTINLVQVGGDSGDANMDAGILAPGTTWVVEDIDNRGIIDNSRVTLGFTEDGRISGQASCNNYSGSYRFASGRLTLDGPLAVTRKMCPPALMNQEQRFLDTLRTGLAVSQNGQGALMLTNGDGHSLLARRQ